MNVVLVATAEGRSAQHSRGWVLVNKPSMRYKVTDIANNRCTVLGPNPD
jgi:hypothetical protein